MAFQIVRNDIAKVKADAIVEAVPADGVPAETRIQKIKQLPAKYRIRFDVPAWQDDGSDMAEKLGRCYVEVLRTAMEAGCRTIAFPLIAGDTYKIPGDLGMKVATDAFLGFLEEQEADILLVVPKDYGDKVSAGLLLDVDAYIRRPKPQPTAPECFLSMPAMQSFAPAEQAMPVRGSVSAPMPMPMPAAPKKSAARRMPAARKRTVAARNASDSLEERLKSMYTDSFEKHLQQLINKKGMKNAQVYAAANISKQYFSKLMKGQVKPSKEKVLALAVGLRLNLDETIDFLRLAGYALSPVSQTDVVVEYFISKQDYNVMKIDIVLFDYGLPPLSDPKSVAG